MSQREIVHRYPAVTVRVEDLRVLWDLMDRRDEPATYQKNSIMRVRRALDGDPEAATPVDGATSRPKPKHPDAITAMSAAVGIPEGKGSDPTLGAEGEPTVEHPEAGCRRCGGLNVDWAAPSPLWNAVMRGGDIDGPWEFGEVICPTCFAVLAVERGIVIGGFRLTAEAVVPLTTTTPSGRVWDPEAWLWRDPESGAEGDSDA